MNLITQFEKARSVSTPLLAITTPDQLALKKQLLAALKQLDENEQKVTGSPRSTPIIVWDCAIGIQGLSDPGISLANTISNEIDPLDLVLVLVTFRNLAPPDSVIMILNAQRQFTEAPIAQAIANLRDHAGVQGQMVILLAPNIVLTLPDELKEDLILLDEPLPDPEQLGKLIDGEYKNFQQNMAENNITVEELTPTNRHRGIEAARGLSDFMARQVFLLSLTPKGMDLARMWEHKRALVEQTPGLSFVRNQLTYADVGGLTEAKAFMSDYFWEGNPDAPSAFVFIDEIEKMFSGLAGDLSGTTSDILGTMLTWMEESGATGQIDVGPAGSGKSFFASVTGANLGIPTIKLDLGGTKGGIVGQSEQQIRNALKVIHAIAGRNVYFFASANKLETLPPELIRRFTDGFVFFDLPTVEERGKIWDIQLRQAGLPEQPLPRDNAWTGAEIRNCCRTAVRQRRSLVEAGARIVPVAATVNGARALAELRQLAVNSGFKSASYPGPYQVPDSEGDQVAAHRSVEEQFSGRKLRYQGEQG